MGLAAGMKRLAALLVLATSLVGSPVFADDDAVSIAQSRYLHDRDASAEQIKRKQAAINRARARMAAMALVLLSVQPGCT
ncbi:MAG: hypothetical protein GKR86_15485, partial [Ilumatobacter sp.]|nr:hypothetical protein [Ilumatobacter sp.]